MPEYLAPGVFIEETSYRAKSIEGVATSTAGFVGRCRFGPTGGKPLLVTSFNEFQRKFGGIQDLGTVTNYLAHSVRAFFDNGGRRAYISRIENGASPATKNGTEWTIAARHPGSGGNCIVKIDAFRSANLGSLNSLRPGDVVELNTTEQPPGKITGSTALSDVRSVLSVDELGVPKLSGADVTSSPSVQRLTLSVTIESETGVKSWRDLSVSEKSSSYIASIVENDDTSPISFTRAASVSDLDLFNSICVKRLKKVNDVEVVDPDIVLTKDGRPSTRASATTLLIRLTGGADGNSVTSTTVEGSAQGPKGLLALELHDDIAIVAAPGLASDQGVRNALISHCERMRYRFAILSGPENATVDNIDGVRAVHDTTYAALYFPWVVVKDPNRAGTLNLPPDGFMAGIYARSDNERGVHKAPANEVVRGALNFSQDISFGQQETLNPDGINCLRFFEGRGYRVWGARTMSSDPEWTYLNVRRLFIFMEHSIDRATQWAVFEPNNERLWLKIRLTIESFLTDVWRTGALMGTSPKEAFFVKCDRSTMTQGDLDNGRLICEIGVAPTKPAEFVIFRIGQWTADASIL